MNDVMERRKITTRSRVRDDEEACRGNEERRTILVPPDKLLNRPAIRAEVCQLTCSPRRNQLRQRAALNGRESSDDMAKKG
jgi:hypothetical protein